MLFQVEVETIQSHCKLLETEMDRQKKTSVAVDTDDGGGVEDEDEDVLVVGERIQEEDDDLGVREEEAALQRRIEGLTEQLEAALRDEDFDLCDNLNAEITSGMHGPITSKLFVRPYMVEGHAWLKAMHG